MSEIKVDTLTGKTTANDITVTVGASATAKLEQGLAKGWCSFDGTASTPVYNDSFNASSLSDGTGGDQAMNLTNAMTDANYPASFLGNARSQFGTPAGSHTSSSVCTIRSTNISDNDTDNSFVQIIIHGDLA